METSVICSDFMNFFYLMVYGRVAPWQKYLKTNQHENALGHLFS
jgi:hypothetical protein